jgi:fermentation-respiration switch protein FrsA (DUF1100 family)
MKITISNLLKPVLVGTALTLTAGMTGTVFAAPSVLTKIAADKNLSAGDMSHGADNFYKSNIVDGQQVTFKNSYNMKVAGNLFAPKNLDKTKKYPAIVVGHPFGAIKEQSANLYAQKMAEKGYVTISFDLSFWGNSEGRPKNSVAPDIYADDYSAAVDYLDTLSYIDKNNIGVIGICAGGGFAISEAKIDSRLKAIATVSMVDMGTATRFGTNEQRQQMVKAAAKQRDVEYVGGIRQYVGGTPDTKAEAKDPASQEFYDFYRTARGSVGFIKNHTTHPTLTSNVKFLNFYPFNDIETISPRPLLFIAGEKAMSLIFSQQAFAKAAAPKELYLVPNAGHVDLYDRTELIPFDKLNAFFGKYLK